MQTFATSKSSESGRRIDHNLPCSEGEGKLCQILDDLTLWNEFLWCLDLQLLEVAPGELGVVCLHEQLSAPVNDNIRHRHACILLHWLLKEHRCVKVLELEETVIPMSHDLFCDALRLSSGLKWLELSSCSLKVFSKVIVEAIGSLAMLQELGISYFELSKDAVVGLASLLKDMTSLRSFSFHDVSLVFSEAELLFKVLGTANITALVLGDITIQFCDEATSSFSWPFDTYVMCSPELVFRMLEQNTALKKLHLTGFAWNPSEAQIMVKALSKNITLESLVINGDLRSRMGSEFFAEMMERNTGLKELALPHAIIQCITPFVKAIGKNATLQKLALGGSDIKLAEAEMFFQAVARSRSLKHVNLGKVKREDVGDLCRIRKETGTETRVTFKAVFENPLLFRNTISLCKSLGNIYFSFRDTVVDPASLCGMFDQLNVCHWLVQLVISLDTAIDNASAASLARFVSSAKALKQLVLDFKTTESTLPVIVGGLSGNKSITNLFLTPWHFDESEKQMFAAMLKGSTTLNYLTLRVFNDSTPEYKDEDGVSFAFLMHIPECLSQNYRVLHVNVKEHRGGEEGMFQINYTMRRNLSFLQRAAQFTLGTRNKRCGEAFERVHQSEALVTKLQELAHVTQAEAREKIKASWRYLDENFLVVAGVVKRKVVCVEQTPGQITLDRIGFDNWIRIRSYLKVGGILDGQGTEHPKASARRRHGRKRRARVASS